MRSPWLLAVPTLIALAAACSTTEAPKDEKTSKASSPIINGTLDSTHPAVVAVLSQQSTMGGECSGTIIKTDPTSHVGWVLTAAHCVDLPPVLVIQGDDYQASDAAHYEIIDYTRHPQYPANAAAGTPHDFAVIRIAGVDASTPVVAIASASDGVGAGVGVTAYGYGRTTLISSGPADGNSKRYRVAMTISSSGLSATKFGYDMSLRGTCQGDSGGPDILGSGASERVVGVHSYLQGDCDGFGVSGRVGNDLAYIDEQLALPPPANNCAYCEQVANSGNQPCAALTRDCLADKDCSGYYDCLSGCGATPTCKTDCLAKFPKAEGPFNAAANCVCTTACKTECGALTCKNVPKCGYKFPAGDCTTCTESTCCEDSLACAADGTCYLCLKNKDADPECATNAARKKLATCVASSCKDACAGTGLDTGADPQSLEDAEPGATTTTTTTSGCAVTRESHAGTTPSASIAALVFGLCILRRRRSDK